MSKRKREATEGKFASTNGLKKARKDRRSGGHEGRNEGSDVAAPQSSVSVNGHATVPGANAEEERLAIKLARKKAKREKKQREKVGTAELPSGGKGVVDNVPNASRKEKRRSRAAGEKFKDSAWRVSDPVGGRLLDLDPVFSPDEKYVPVQSLGTLLRD